MSLLRIVARFQFYLIFMSFGQSFEERLAELDSKSEPHAYEHIHINSRRDRQPFRRRAKGQPDWDSMYFFELVPSVWHWG